MTTSTSTSRTPARLSAVWFADIVGYTSMSAENHARALAIVDVFQELARTIVETHGGRIVKFIGDAALAEFPSTTSAVQAANELKLAFLARSAEKGHRTSLRIGVHLGEIEAAADGDIYGDGVNTASRLQGAAEPGHVLVSEDVWRSLRSHPEFAFEPAGRRRLRGTGLPMAVFEAVSTTDGAGSASGLAWLRGWRLLLLLAAHAAIGGALLIGINRMVARQATPALTFDVARVWYMGAFPLLLLIGWFHGYQRHRRATRGEKILVAATILLLLGFTGDAVGRHIDRVRARDLAVASGLDARRIAVLYFDNVRDDTSQAYLAAGLTEDLIDELSGVRALDVISANGVAQFRDSGLAPDSIARLLRVGTVVGGSIEPDGDELRVNVRLIDGVSGADLHRASLTLPVGDVFRIRNEIVAEVAGFLREELGEEVRLRERRSGTDVTAAWTLVHRADELMDRAAHTLEAGDGDAALAAYGVADSLLAQAAQMDEAWPEPLVMRGRIAFEVSRAQHDPHEAISWNERARTHAAAALERDANDPAGLELRGTIDYWSYLLNAAPDEQTHQRLLESARTDLERARDLDPGRASAYSTLSHLYYNYDLAAAVLAARRAYEEDAWLDVADAVVWRLFNGSLDLEQFSQAERWCTEGRERFPHMYQFTMCALMLMVTPAKEPDVGEAWRLAARIDSIAGDNDRPYARIMSELSVGGVLARAEMVDSARSVLLRARAYVTPEVDPNQEMYAYEAFMRTLTGDDEEARNLLLRYAAANPGHLAASRGSDTAWWWRTLRDRSWFRELAQH